MLNTWDRKWKILQWLSEKCYTNELLLFSMSVKHLISSLGMKFLRIVSQNWSPALMVFMLSLKDFHFYILHGMYTILIGGSQEPPWRNWAPMHSMHRWPNYSSALSNQLWNGPQISELINVLGHITTNSDLNIQCQVQKIPTTNEKQQQKLKKGKN